MSVHDALLALMRSRDRKGLSQGAAAAWCRIGSACNQVRM
jgi:hypothetical protein